MSDFLPPDYQIPQIIGYPSDHNEIAFDVYEKYLRSFTSLLETQYSSLENLIKDIIGKITKIKHNPNLDLKYIKRFLFLGWNTEYLASMNDNSPDIEVLRVNNQWKPIQVYYSIYTLSEASIYSATLIKSDSHSKCLKNLSNFLESSSLYPWNLCFTGHEGKVGKLARTIRPINFPQEIRIPNSMERQNIQPVESIACCLQAEHRNRVEEYRKRGKGQPYQYEYNPGITTIFHFLYRLRIKSNYKDVEIFLAPAPGFMVQNFSNHLTLVNTYSNALFEVILTRTIGRLSLVKLIDDFLKINNKADFIVSRKDLYNKLIT
jgi:hypothetical protein